VREAFVVLEAQGFLERQPHRGVLVADLFADMDGLRELCSAVELISARRAAERQDPRAMREMESTIEAGRAALRAANPARLKDANYQFHIALSRASGSRSLSEATVTFLSRTFFTAPMDLARMTTSLQAHVDLLAAIRRGDKVRAVAVAKRHLGRFRQTSLSIQKRRGATSRHARAAKGRRR
jgi:DNA-binding GntR family transcriptional regulator